MKHVCPLCADIFDSAITDTNVLTNYCTPCKSNLPGAIVLREISTQPNPNMPAAMKTQEGTELFFTGRQQAVPALGGLIANELGYEHIEPRLHYVAIPILDTDWEHIVEGADIFLSNFISVLAVASEYNNNNNTQCNKDTSECCVCFYKAETTEEDTENVVYIEGMPHTAATTDDNEEQKINELVLPHLLDGTGLQGIVVDNAIGEDSWNKIQKSFYILFDYIQNVGIIGNRI